MESSGESGILRTLRDIQRTVPDREFFTHNRLLGKSTQSKKKTKGGFRLIGGKKKIKFDIETAREKIKSFHNSFMAAKRGEQKENSAEYGIMSINEMKDFRALVRQAADEDEDAADVHALNAIITYVDLKNSSVVSGKQNILRDCLKKIGLALLSDGGLSMFHITWFLTIYREYLSRFKMFPRNEFQLAQREGTEEAKGIAKRLHRKQFEITHYLGLVDDKIREVRLITQLAQQEPVKRSIHGQRGCSQADIQRIFKERITAEGPATVQSGQVNEVSLIMAYALFFARIPMLTPVVEMIRNKIPTINVEGTLYRQKITIAQKQNMLEIARGMHQDDGSDAYKKKLFLLAEGVFKYCTRVIAENNLQRILLKNDIYAHPFLKQAVILITYKNIFRTRREAYLKSLAESKSLLESLKSYTNSGHKALRQMAENAAVYERNIEAIITQMKSEESAGYQEQDVGGSHENW